MHSATTWIGGCGHGDRARSRAIFIDSSPFLQGESGVPRTDCLRRHDAARSPAVKTDKVLQPAGNDRGSDHEYGHTAKCHAAGRPVVGIAILVAPLKMGPTLRRLPGGVCRRDSPARSNPIMTALYVFAAMTLLFALALGARRLTRWDLCALCLSVSLTWIGLLILHKTEIFTDTALLAILMGQSVTGVFYMLRDRVPRVLRIFTLPFFLSLTAVSYILITSDFIISSLMFLAVMWIGAWIIFASRNDPGTQPLATAVIECCGREDSSWS